jgi:hypothetical protein
VVSPDEIEPIFFVEFAHEPKHMAMCSSYIRESFVLPKLISISDFDVGEPFLVVVVQCVKEEILIMGEVVRPAIITSVTIAKEDEFRRVVERDFPG